MVEFYKLLKEQGEIILSVELIFVEKVGQEDMPNEVINIHCDAEVLSNYLYSEGTENLSNAEKEYIIVKYLYNNVVRIAEQRKKEVGVYDISFICKVDNLNSKIVDLKKILEYYECDYVKAPLYDANGDIFIKYINVAI